MRAALALIAACALCATPAVAQGKTKDGIAPQSVQALDVCEGFAKGDVMAVDTAIAQGWDAYSQDSESPYVQSFAASKELPGIGPADLFALVEDYPDTTFGYCRIDVPSPNGSNGQAAIQAIQNLDGYEGEGSQTADGSFASLVGGEGNQKKLLLAHWTADSFVIQLSTVTPKAAPAL